MWVLSLPNDKLNERIETKNFPYNHPPLEDQSKHVTSNKRF